MDHEAKLVSPIRMDTSSKSLGFTKLEAFLEEDILPRNKWVSEDDRAYSGLCLSLIHI